MNKQQKNNNNYNKKKMQVENVILTFQTVKPLPKKGKLL